jgi:hypothetical protein
MVSRPRPWPLWPWRLPRVSASLFFLIGTELLDLTYFFFFSPTIKRAHRFATDFTACIDDDNRVEAGEDAEERLPPPLRPRR